MNLFVIPTNRDISPSLSSVLSEIEAIGDNSQILVVDNSKPSIANVNRKTISESSKASGIRMFYVDMDKASQLSTKISRYLNVEEKTVTNHLIPVGTDYGRIFNLLFIFTSLLGYESFHRRDSDCFVNNLEPKQYPIFQELKVLGKRVSETSSSIEYKEDNPWGKDESFLITGSDYSGNWNLDFGDLATEDPRVLEKFFELLGIPSDAIQDQIDNLVSVKKNEFDRKPVAKTGFSIPNYPDCGNVAMKKVFRIVPSFIGLNGIGYDYHTYFISFLCRVPISFHWSRIEHVFTSDRKDYSDVDKLFNYWKGIVKQIELDKVYTSFIKNHWAGLDRKLEGSGLERLNDLAEKYLADSFVSALGAISIESIIDDINEICSDILGKCEREEYKKVGDFLTENGCEIAKEVISDFGESIELQRSWASYIRAVDQIHKDEGPSEYIYEYS